jgi:hypothetical protein
MIQKVVRNNFETCLKNLHKYNKNALVESDIRFMITLPFLNSIKSVIFAIFAPIL